MALSQSWTHANGALNPDNYLVTPLVNLGKTVKFWASAENLDDAAEHFGIAVSTGSNTDPNDFTMVQEWTLSAKGGGGPRGFRDQGTWYQFTVDLSAYAGQTGYIALRHFNCSDQFVLAIDDFMYGDVGFTDGFEHGLGRWTLIDGDGDGNNWESFSATTNASPFLGEGMAVSYSRQNNVELYPNNFLVSPLVELGGIVTFCTSAVDEAYASEHFGIAVSTSSNTNPSDFVMVREWTLLSKGDLHDDPRVHVHQGSWWMWSANLSAYAGQTGYIALRHFNCTDLSGIYVDDFSYNRMVFSTGTTLVGLDPGTTYEVQVQGITPFGLTEWSDPVTFTTESESVAQTIELAEGWNWVSTYIDAEDPIELLQMLETALGEDGLVIKSMDDYTTYEGGEWGAMGDLDDEGIVNEQMYAIQVSADCSVQLQGLLASPSAHAITIYPGWNWIGFPIDQVMSIEDALSDYEPEDGDVIKDMEDYSSYADGWSDTGDLEELTPGHGYKYYSNSTEPKTLVFSAGMKKKCLSAGRVGGAIPNR